MSLETTSISQLPLSNTNQPAVQQPTVQQPPQQQNINLEISDNNTQMNYNTQVAQTPQINQQEQLVSVVSGIQKAAAAGVTNLPSRDRPMNTQVINTDKQVNPNYVPEQQKEIDYVKNYETRQEVFKNEVVNVNKKDNMEYIINEIQIPAIVGLLYCIFQLPITKTFMNNHLGFLYKSDGNLKTRGYLVISGLFGKLYYIMTKSIKLMII